MTLKELMKVAIEEEIVNRHDQATQTQGQDQGDHIEVSIQRTSKRILVTFQDKARSEDS